jgi:hypothetical protein
LATASGAAGGAFGLATLPIELPISTIVMLRSIADIARAEGEDMSDPETALACVQVFALGSGPGAANPSESGYFVVRGMLAKSVTHAARFIAERGVEKGGPLLVRFIAQVASRFGTVVTQKLAAQAIPVIGEVSLKCSSKRWINGRLGGADKITEPDDGSPSAALSKLKSLPSDFAYSWRSSGRKPGQMR